MCRTKKYCFIEMVHPFPRDNRTKTRPPALQTSIETKALFQLLWCMKREDKKYMYKTKQFTYKTLILFTQYYIYDISAL